MAWYHRYQYAEFINPPTPELLHKALPIVRLQIDDDTRSVTQVQLEFAPGDYRWVVRELVTLYKGAPAIANIENLDQTTVRKFFRHKRIVGGQS